MHSETIIMDVSASDMMDENESVPEIGEVGVDMVDEILDARSNATNAVNDDNNVSVSHLAMAILELVTKTAIVVANLDTTNASESGVVGIVTIINMVMVNAITILVEVVMVTIMVSESVSTSRQMATIVDTNDPIIAVDDVITRINQMAEIVAETTIVVVITKSLVRVT